MARNASGTIRGGNEGKNGVKTARNAKKRGVSRETMKKLRNGVKRRRKSDVSREKWAQVRICGKRGQKACFTWNNRRVDTEQGKSQRKMGKTGGNRGRIVQKTGYFLRERQFVGGVGCGFAHLRRSEAKKRSILLVSRETMMRGGMVGGESGAIWLVFGVLARE